MLDLKRFHFIPIQCYASTIVHVTATKVRFWGWQKLKQNDPCVLVLGTTIATMGIAFLSQIYQTVGNFAYCNTCAQTDSDCHGMMKLFEITFFGSNDSRVPLLAQLGPDVHVEV